LIQIFFVILVYYRYALRTLNLIVAVNYHLGNIGTISARIASTLYTDFVTSPRYGN